jgi:hypothetical protein
MARYYARRLFCTNAEAVLEDLTAAGDAEERFLDCVAGCAARGGTQQNRPAASLGMTIMEEAAIWCPFFPQSEGC